MGLHNPCLVNIGFVMRTLYLPIASYIYTLSNFIIYSDFTLKNIYLNCIFFSHILIEKCMCLKFDSQRTHHRLYLKDGQSVATLICPRCLRSPRLSPCILFFIVYFTLNNDNDFKQMNTVALAIS